MANQTPIACTLTEAELPDRIASARALGERALTGLEVGGRRALLRFDGERAEVEALVAAERRCCPFLTFEIIRSAGVIELEIRLPRRRRADPAGFGRRSGRGLGGRARLRPTGARRS
jgi:hypothetical protein